MSYFIILVVIALIGALVTVGIISSKVETISPKTPRESKGEEQKNFYTMK
ncbi:Uncharacterised protein [Bacillus tequilensis]|nr:Uncharacterised protein [Bacillus tequilensis]